MNVLSLFDGISCGRIALERAGIEVNKYYASEIDKNAIAISNDNYEDIIRLGDVNNIDLTTLPKIDLILAGSPCQGFSRNGKGLNFSDERSKLFFSFKNILEWIKENNNPNVKFLLENVNMKREWKETIDSLLGVNGICINSKTITAQNRERIYWTNFKFEVIKEKDCDLKDILENVDLSNYKEREGLLIDPTLSENEVKLINVVEGEVRISQATKQGYITACDGDGVNLQFPTSKTRRGRVTKNKSATLDCSCNLCVMQGNVIRKLTITELEKLQTLPTNYTNSVSDSKRRKAIGNGWAVDIITHILKGLK